MKYTAEEQQQLFEMILPHVKEYAEKTMLQVMMKAEEILNHDEIFESFLKAYEKALHEVEYVNVFEKTSFIEAFKEHKEHTKRIAKIRARRREL